MIKTNREDVRQFLKGQIREKLARCTEKQQELFNLMYPMGITKMGDDKIDWALSQIENTIRKNESKNIAV